MLTLQNVCIDLHKNTSLNLPWQATELFWHWIITVLELRARGMEDVSAVGFAVELLFVHLSDRAVRSWVGLCLSFL